MASLDSAKGPSATVCPFFQVTILPSSASGWADLIFPRATSRSYKALHWLITFCSSSGDKFLCQCVPRNNSRYSDVGVCVLMWSFSLWFFASLRSNDERIPPLRDNILLFFKHSAISRPE